MNSFNFLLVLACAFASSTVAFTSPAVVSQARIVAPEQPNFVKFYPLAASGDGVVELADEDEAAAPTEVVAVESKEEEEQVVAPFLSQGEISEEAMEMDLSDPKQARVMFYIILSLLPVLFLIPLMLGSRDLIPMDMLPPVEIN